MDEFVLPKAVTVSIGLLGVEVEIPYGCDAGKLLDSARLEEIERRILAIEERLKAA